MRCTYTPQEMIVKDKCTKAGLSFCMNRDFILIWGNGKVFAKHIDDMNAYLGVEQ